MPCTSWPQKSLRYKEDSERELVVAVLWPYRRWDCGRSRRVDCEHPDTSVPTRTLLSVAAMFFHVRRHIEKVQRNSDCGPVLAAAGAVVRRLGHGRAPREQRVRVAGRGAHFHAPHWTPVGTSAQRWVQCEFSVGNFLPNGAKRRAGGSYYVAPATDKPSYRVHAKIVFGMQHWRRGGH